MKGSVEIALITKKGFSRGVFQKRPGGSLLRTGNVLYLHLLDDSMVAYARQNPLDSLFKIGELQVAQWRSYLNKKW